MDNLRGQRMSMKNVCPEEMAEMAEMWRQSRLMEEMMDKRRSQHMAMRNSVMMDEIRPLQRQVSRKEAAAPSPMPEINHKKHSCTDVHCLIIFVCFIVAWFYIAHFALSQGDLNRVVLPTDSKNRKCGIDSGVVNKPYLYFFDLDKCLDVETALGGCKTKQVCVEQCPQQAFVWGDHVADSELENAKNLLICDDDVDKKELRTRAQINSAVAQGHCSALYVKSTVVFNYCMPFSSQDLCNFLPDSLKNRKRRSLPPPSEALSLNDVFDRYDEFKRRTAQFCRRNDTTPDVMLKQKVEQTHSSSTKLIAAIIAKFGSNDSVGNERLAEDIKKDLKSSWKVIAMAFIIHVTLALLFIALLRYVARPLVWLSIFGVFIGLALSLLYSVKQYSFYSRYPTVPQHSVNLMASLENIVHNKDFWMWVSVLTGAVFVIILLVVLVLRKRIAIAIALIKEASKAITSTISSIFFPLFPGFLYILVSILAGVVLLYLSSIGNNSFRVFMQLDANNPLPVESCECDGPAMSYELNGKCLPDVFEAHCHISNTNRSCVETVCRFAEIEKTPMVQWFTYFCIFTYFWVVFFISAYGDMVLACTFSMWYWTFDKKNNLETMPVFKAMAKTTLYHLGTLAFGSLVLAVCRMIRYLLDFLEKRLKMYNNKLTQALLCCMKCFFWLLENFLRFLNRNAYITCAIHSTSFCASSQKAFGLITQNILRMYAIDKVSDFLFFLSKVLLTACTCFATHLVLTTYPQVFNVNYPWVPIFFIIILGYIMADVIFSTYSMAVDTLFFCFLEDSNENDGSAEKPYYMSKNLSKLLNEKNAQKKVKKMRGDFIRQ
ncbi:choline transporter-like 2 [Musca domestica]|uniref:Choline transporter-like 2 n=1 Tax=Musca domestica TaxID=7370 RepID=A0A9J7D1A4_MUSDO|nr:choline transporter-like 2 [Musca domestica]